MTIDANGQDRWASCLLAFKSESMMDYSKTTATAVEKMRAQARARRKETGQTLTVCREEVARDNGYPNWKAVTLFAKLYSRSQSSENVLSDERAEQYRSICAEIKKDTSKYFDYLRSLGVASVVHNDLKSDVFIDVTIEGRRFLAIIYPGGPSILDHRWGSNSSPYGVSVISFCDGKGLFGNGAANAGWKVCKYKHQGRIDLDGLSLHGIRSLAIEMGLYIHSPMPDVDMMMPYVNEQLAFRHSKAWNALIEWGRKHPRKLQRRYLGDYLGSWAIEVAENIKELNKNLNITTKAK